AVRRPAGDLDRRPAGRALEPARPRRVRQLVGDAARPRGRHAAAAGRPAPGSAPARPPGGRARRGRAARVPQLRAPPRLAAGAGPDYGRVELGQGQRVQVEFVSANPTGVLNAANGRAGALGDALANLLDFAGYRVQREYYVNDAGSRMKAFYATVMARYRQAFGLAAEVPSDGYHGKDLIQFAEEIKVEHGDRFLHGDPEAA